MSVILSICLRDFKMNRLMLLLVTATAVSVANCGMYCGIVKLIPEDPNAAHVNGNITFIQDVENGPVRIRGTISGLSKGKHGFHVHEKGDMRQGCISAGPHFNPTKKSHGGPQAEERHVGDLGNIIANDEGIATVDTVDSVISLTGPNSIFGRSLVVHSSEDDLGYGHEDDSPTTGHSGGRIACGIIGVLLVP